MNDFDDRLGRALRDDDVDRTAQPDFGTVQGAGRRRRQRRLGAIGVAMSVVVVGAGFAIATLAQSDLDERVVTDTAPSTEVPLPVPTVPIPITTDPRSATTTDPAPQTSATTPPVSTTPVTVAPSTTEPAVSVPAAEIRGLDVADEYVGATTVLDFDNQLVIRNAAGDALWSYQYCAFEQRCSATVQTVLDDGVWVVVGQNTDENGFPASSTLRRVDFDGLTAEVRAETEAGTYLAVGQPTVLGELVAVAKPDSRFARLIDVSVTLPDGEVRVLAADVTDVEVSADGRYVATTSSRPWPSEDYGRVYLTVRDLQTGRSNDTVLEGAVTAAPVEFSADGSMLVLRHTFEDRSDFVIDPWSSGQISALEAVVTGSEVCLVDLSTALVATWYSGYAEESASIGTVRRVEINTGDVVSDLELDTFGSSLVCAPDGAVTFRRVPLREVILGSGDDPFVLTEPDYTAPADIVRVAADGTQSVLQTGDVTMHAIR